MYKIIIDGKPIPWKAPVVTRNGTFSPNGKEKRAKKAIVKAQWHNSPLEGAIHADLFFIMPIPKGASKVQRAAMLEKEIFPATRPDLTNLQKAAEDFLSGIVINDDNQIVSICSKKIFGENPKTIIDIYELS